MCERAGKQRRRDLHVKHNTNVIQIGRTFKFTQFPLSCIRTGLAEHKQRMHAWCPAAMRRRRCWKRENVKTYLGDSVFCNKMEYKMKIIRTEMWCCHQWRVAWSLPPTGSLFHTKDNRRPMNGFVETGKGFAPLCEARDARQTNMSQSEHFAEWSFVRSYHWF